MSKKDVIIDTTTAASTQIATIMTITNPTHSVGAIIAIALASGISKELLKHREDDINKLAAELSTKTMGKKIRMMEEQQLIDDLIYSVEKILSQRTEPKRVLMRSVLLGYIDTEHKTAYPLEKIYKAIENLTFADIDFFKRILEAMKIKENYPVPWVSKTIMDNHKVPLKAQEDMMILTHTENTQHQQSKANLISEGLIIETKEGVGQWGAGGGTPQIYVTIFGNYFKKYLLRAK